MKRAENMDGSTETNLPSMKTAEIMDGRHKMKVPSMKRAEIMDGRHKINLPSMKSGEFMDGRYEEPRKCHYWELSGLIFYLRPLDAIMSVRVSLNSLAAASCSTVRCIL
jgi:hypothetical protein